MPRPVNQKSGIRTERRSVEGASRPLSHVTRKASKIVLSAVVICGLLAVVVTQSSSVAGFMNRPISKVRIENRWQQTSEEEVAAVLSEFMGAGFFSFDVRGAKQKLEEMSWVEFVSVKRIWPDTLALELKEEIVIAKWGEGSYLNQIGEVITPDKPSRNLMLPELIGPVGSQVEVMRRYQQLNQLLLPEAISLSRLSLSLRGSWELTLNNSVQVAAGKDDVFENITRLVGFLTSQPSININDIASVDLRYNNGFAVKAVDQNMVGVAVR
ncbi:MAG: cell division protein FtsQ/DivIB [Pseudohongiellaceae bacterium]